MANDVDKFVLQYQVELRDSIARLEALQKKLTETNKKGKEAGKGLIDAFKEISPTIGKTIDFVGKLNTKFGTLTATFAVLAAAIKVTNEAMKEFNERQKIAYQTGVGTIAQTNFERNMRAASGGQVNRSAAREALSTISNITMEAYTDPTRRGPAARKLQRMGVSAVGKGGGIASTDDVAAQMSAQMAKMTREQAIAMGQLIGLTAQQTEALRTLNGATMEATHMTNDEALHKKQAAEASKELQGAYNEMSENLKQAFDTIGEDLMPSIAALMKALAKLTEWFKDGVRWVTDFGDHFGRFITAIGSHWKELITGRMTIGEAIDAAKVESAAPPAAQTQAAEEAPYKEIHKTLAQETLNINTFANAVDKFSGAVDQGRAWAAWAGSVGRATGLAGGGQGDTLGLGEVKGGGVSFNPSAQAQMLGAVGSVPGAPPGSAAASGAKGRKTQQIDLTQWEPLIQEASAKYGVSPEWMRAVMSLESGGHPEKVSKKGAIGLMQVMPENFKRMGINANMMADPRTNVMAGGKILADAFRMAKGDPDLALKIYQGGPNQKIWGRENAIYPTLVRQYYQGGGAPVAGGVPTPTSAPVAGAMSAAQADSLNPTARPTFGFSGPGVRFGKGEGQETTQYSIVRGMLAQAMGLKDPSQLTRNKRITKADVEWAGSNVMAELQGARYNIKQQLSNPMSSQYEKENLGLKLKNVDLQIAGLMNYMPNLLGRAKEGPRQVTLGQMRITINAGQVSDPNELARIIQREVNMTLRELVNDSSTAKNA